MKLKDILSDEAYEPTQTDPTKYLDKITTIKIFVATIDLEFLYLDKNCQNVQIRKFTPNT